MISAYKSSTFHVEYDAVKRLCSEWHPLKRIMKTIYLMANSRVCGQ